MRPVLILFAKAPVPGRVKTRLTPPLTPESAAQLHEAFVLDSIERLKCLKTVADLELHTDILTDAWKGSAIPRSLQCEGDLGLKMFQSLRRALDAGRPQAMIVGTDAPTLPVEHLEALLSSPADMALGPCDDGGYFAIACRRVCPGMFNGVTWSAGDTLLRTVESATACGLSVEQGPSWYDIDTAADLNHLRAAPNLPRHTAQLLQKLEYGYGNC